LLRQQQASFNGNATKRRRYIHTFVCLCRTRKRNGLTINMHVDHSPLVVSIRKSRHSVIDAFKATIPASPEYGFGTGSRPPLNEPSTTPGPGAYPRNTTLCNSIDSTIPSAPMFSLRSRQKFGDPIGRSMSATAPIEPGPGHYATQGKFLCGSTPPAIGFTRSKLNSYRRDFAPGPGAYTLALKHNRVPLSTQHRSPAAFLGTGQRLQFAQQGTSNVGPGEYNSQIGACDAQPDSRRKNPPVAKIGTGYVKPDLRFHKPRLEEPLPGPGSYKIPSLVASHSAGIPYRSAPAASLSGRNKFGSLF
jgi:hypothetical protein